MRYVNEEMGIDARVTCTRNGVWLVTLWDLWSGVKLGAVRRFGTEALARAHAATYVGWAACAYAARVVGR